MSVCLGDVFDFLCVVLFLVFYNIIIIIFILYSATSIIVCGASQHITITLLYHVLLALGNQNTCRFHPLPWFSCSFQFYNIDLVDNGVVQKPALIDCLLYTDRINASHNLLVYTFMLIYVLINQSICVIIT